MKLRISISGVSPVLYHRTSVTSAVRILQDNVFVLSPAEPSVAEKAVSKRGIYYLSTARFPYASETKLGFSPSVLLVLNGTLLGRNLKGSAVDYWGEEYRKLGKYEAEDRLFSDKPILKRARKYIEEVHIFVNPDTTIRRSAKALRQLLITSKKNRIPTFIYDDEKAAAVLNRRKAKTLAQLGYDVQGRGLRTPEELLKPTRTRPDRTYLKPYYELMITPAGRRHTLSKEAEKVLRTIAMYPDSAVSNIRTTMHNAKSSVGTKDHGYIAKILAYLKRHDLSLEELSGHLLDKWDY